MYIFFIIVVYIEEVYSNPDNVIDGTLKSTKS